LIRQTNGEQIMMLMLVAEDKKGRGIAIRFFDSEEGSMRVRKLTRKQIRKDFPELSLEHDIHWEVYEPRIKHGGWPHYIGPSEYYEQ
jgi:hypothetical protein